MTAEVVQQIVGQGAVWPMLTMQNILDEVQLSIEAGSSGKPDKQLEIQNFERIVPLLLQIPQINPEWLAKEAVKRLDDQVDFADALLPPNLGMSIHAMNAAGGGAGAAPSGGDPSQDPNAQGGSGGEQGAPTETQGDAPDGGASADRETGVP